jgi:hypothetical protein
MLGKGHAGAPDRLFRRVFAVLIMVLVLELRQPEIPTMPPCSRCAD